MDLKNIYLPWDLKYRPATIDDLIITNKNEQKLREYLDRGAINNVLLSGTHGIGKTTWAEMVMNHLVPRDDIKIINGSTENGIDVIRNELKDFIGTTSYSGNLKIVFIDEFDGFTFQAQQGLRKDIEKYSDTARFIFACNYPHKILGPIKDRCAKFDLTIPNTSEFRNKVLLRLFDILEAEKITNVNVSELREFIKTKKTKISKTSIKQLQQLIDLVKSRLPSIRSIIKDLEELCIVNNKFVFTEIIQKTEKYVNDIIDLLCLNNIDFSHGDEILKILRENNVNNIMPLVEAIFKNAKAISPSKYAQIYIMLGEMQYRDTFSPNKIIHIMAYINKIIILKNE